MRLTGYDRGDRGFGIRDLVVALPSVGCTNRTVELLARAEPRIHPITHQHGCAQLGDDMGVTAEVLARVCANPNVRAAVIVGLGCETNQSDRLLERARSYGARVERAVLQELGGVSATVAGVRALAAPILEEEPVHRPMRPDQVTIGVIRDAESGAAGAELAPAVEAGLAERGFGVLDPGEPAAEPARTRGRSESDRIALVPRAWAGSGSPLAIAGMPLLVANRTEQLTVLAARGAQLCIFITGRANPIGSPVTPTLKVGVDPRQQPLVGGILDLIAGGDDAARVVEAARAVASGEPVVAEAAGQRDFGIPRLLPTM